MVCCPPDSAAGHLLRIARSQLLCFASFRSRQLSDRNSIWMSRRILRRNRMDGFCIPKNVAEMDFTFRQHPAWAPLVSLAPAGYRPSRTAAPHGSYTLHYFLAFTCAMTAMRVVIAWVYSNTGSVLLTQLLHASSTGALVIFSPPRVNASQEAAWYFAYAILLWAFVAVIAAVWGRTLTRPLEPERALEAKS